MVTTVSAMDMVKARYHDRGYDAQPVDQEAVEAFLGGADEMPREQLIKVVQRMHSMIQRGEKARGPKGMVSLETMATAADRLTEIVKAKG